MKVALDYKRELVTLQRYAYHLAMAVLQTTLYLDDAEVRNYVDDVIRITQEEVLKS